jgi:hypothetical protein
MDDEPGHQLFVDRLVNVIAVGVAALADQQIGLRRIAGFAGGGANRRVG